MAGTARLHTKAIADELAALIDASANLTLKACQFGAVEFLAFAGNLGDSIPGVFIKPEATPFRRDRSAGKTFNVEEVFRICYAFPTGDNTLHIPDTVATDGNLIMRALAADVKLSNIASAIKPDQIVESYPLDVVWFGEEDTIFVQHELPIRVLTMRWGVQWLCRNTT